MAERASLTLIVPGMGRELAGAVPGGDAPRLAQLAARGSLRYEWDRSDLQGGALTSWQRGLLWALQLAAEHPSALLTALAHDLVDDPAGDLDVAATGDWLHADLVHLAAGLDHLSLVELPADLQATAAERTALEPQLREHLHACGWQLHVLPAGGWLIRTSARLQAIIPCPAAAAANDLQYAMPQGVDAVTLKRLMTEVQMLLHGHPVNQQRELRGLPAANSIWLWGNGIPAARLQPLPPAFGSEDYLRGLYRLHTGNLQPLPASGAELLRLLPQRGRCVTVLPAQSASGFEQLWLAPLMQGLRARRLDQLDLVLDGWHLSIDRRGLRRFWRRPLPPGSWVA